MSPRRMLLYDIPDSCQLIHQYLDELTRTLSDLSAELVLEHLKEVADYGWLLSECRPVGEGLFELDIHVGRGKKTRVLFFETPKGDYMALHAFTVETGADADRGYSIAAQRKRDLI